MKKLILFLILLSGVAFSQVTLSSRDSITTLVTTDITGWQTKVAGSFTNRQLSWSNLRSNIIDYIDGLANTWALKQTFSSGATFNAAGTGVVTFSDSVLSNTTFNYFTGIYPYNAFSFIGSYGAHHLRIYSKNFVLVNTSGTDSAIISYENSKITFDKSIKVKDSTFTIGSSELGGQLRLLATDTLVVKTIKPLYGYNPIKVNAMLSYSGGRHSVNSLTTKLTIDSVTILLDALNTATIDTLVFGITSTDPFDFIPVMIMNEGAFNVTFTDNNGAGFTGCMRLDGNAVLYQNDFLYLAYYPNAQRWYEISRSINRYTGNQYGVYTPTLTEVANLDGQTAFGCQYSRVGDVVTVSGKIGLDATTTATITGLRISLPISSNIVATENCGGTAYSTTVAEGAAILANVANDEAELTYLAISTALQTMHFQFTYQIK